MKFLIISFKSRNDTISFFNILKKHNIFCSIINTPKTIGSSCSLSIKTNINSLARVQKLINFNNPSVSIFIYEPQLNFASKIS